MKIVQVDEQNQHNIYIAIMRQLSSYFLLSCKDNIAFTHTCTVISMYIVLYICVSR